jgi:hypothetical protein
VISFVWQSRVWSMVASVSQYGDISTAISLIRSKLSLSQSLFGLAFLFLDCFRSSLPSILAVDWWASYRWQLEQIEMVVPSWDNTQIFSSSMGIRCQRSFLQPHRCIVPSYRWYSSVPIVTSCKSLDGCIWYFPRLNIAHRVLFLDK